MSTILAVDDSVTMRKCLEITFSGTEFNLVAVGNAQEALEKVKTLSPDLVIADVSLPPNDGYELCSTIKLAAPDLPVLMLSSKQHPFDPGKGAQADDHIDKPFDTQVMQDRARGLVKHSEKSDTDVPGAPAERPDRMMAERAPVTQQKPMGADREAARNEIPAPRRKRPTPAMMTNPLKPQPTPAGPGSPGVAAMRRTVPFAMPGSAKRDGGVERRAVPGSPQGLTLPGSPAATMPMGAREREASELLGRGAQGMPGERTAPQQQHGGGPGSPTQPSAQAFHPHHAQAGFQAPIGPESAAPATPSPFTAHKSSVEKKPTGDTLPGVPQAPGDGAHAHGDGAGDGASWAGAGSPPPVGPALAQLAADKAADLETKLSSLGLTQQQVEGVLSLSREIIEQVVWDVVPTLAETLIKEEIKRLTKDG